MNILITGANGYIGLRLLTKLSNSPHQITAVVRNAARIPPAVKALYHNKTSSRLNILEIDFLTKSDHFPECPKDTDVAFYLMHSMGEGGDFENREINCANQFIAWIKPTTTKQIVYLSGLLPESNAFSRHLASRNRVHQLLSNSVIPVTTLRASIIVGSGSASFEIIRDLVEKLPIMITPKWVRTRCQPIAVRNVIDYLVGVIGKEECYSQSYDIGGPEQMSYREMMLGYAKTRKLHRLLIPVPVFSPRLSSYWLSIMTATNYQLAKALVGSLHMETICRENSIRKLLPINLLSYSEAIERAFSKIAQNHVPSTWYGALSSGRLSHQQLQSIEVPEFGILQDCRRYTLTAEKNDVINSIWSLGGQNGWPAMHWAWKLRGLIDKACGGIGVRRGRRHPRELKSGDALDFWRVILADQPTGRLILYAEMKLPGEAWLSFEVSNGNLTQTATFRPHGILGRLYWYCTFPLHLFLFPGMAKTLASGLWPAKRTSD